MNVVMLAYSGSDFQKSLTQTSIESLRRSAPSGNPSLDDLKITIVESGPKTHDYAKIDCIVRYSASGGFNYNKALNEGVNSALKAFSQSDWWCFTNNDVIFGEEWLAEIGKAVAADPSLDVVSPNCKPPQARIPKSGVDIGYALGKTFSGCCFLLKNSVLARLFPFDERFSFYFQDDDILEQLKIAGIRTGRVMASRIFHIEGQTEKSNNIQKLLIGQSQYIQKYSVQAYYECEKAKQVFWREYGEL